MNVLVPPFIYDVGVTAVHNARCDAGKAQIRADTNLVSRLKELAATTTPPATTTSPGGDDAAVSEKASDLSSSAARSKANDESGLNAIGSARRCLFELGIDVDGVAATLGAPLPPSPAGRKQPSMHRSDQQRQAADNDGTDGGSATIMLSYSWAQQDLVTKIRKSLGARGYSVWIDIEQMQGSTVDCMAAAVEDAAIVCYGVSRSYKESANCRLELNYAHAQGKKMIPLVLEANYSPNGQYSTVHVQCSAVQCSAVQ